MTELSENSKLDNSKTGVVIWFCAKKGIGFIERDNGGKDLFVHWTNIKEMEGFKTLKAGQVISFEVGENHKGEQAENVVILSEPEDQEQDQRETEE